jgi:lipopolysaccharide assembly outer membrane protein LptD (OstA)
MLKFISSLFVFLVGYASPLRAQDSLRTPATDTGTLVYIIHADRLGYKKIDSVNEINTLAGKVALRQNQTLFYCDSAVVKKPGNVVEAFGNVHINDADSIHTYSDYLIYYADKKLAFLKKKVRMTDGNGTLTTEELEYDTRQKIGSYRNGGRIVKGTTIIISKEATYYSELKDIYFKKNVKMTDPKTNLDADSLLYNTESQIATFITKTFIRDSSGTTIVTSDGFYDTKNKTARLGKRAVVNDGKGVTVTGDDIYTDDKTGQTIITGNAVFKDTVQKISLLSNYMIFDKNNNTVLATQHPLMIIKQDEDSIYVTADTLFSARIRDFKDSTYKKLLKDTIKTVTVLDTKDTSDIRFFQGYHHVRIFSDSLQAVCDSLFYSGEDSVFRLFNSPIVWASNTNQVTGDTIYLFTKNKKAERIQVFENGMAVNKSGENMYNQLRGNTINGYFKEGNIDYMRAKGSAQSIYYAKDENEGMVGLNNASGDIIDMRFEDKELKKVIFIRDVTGVMYPIRQVPEEKKQLRNFKWLDEKRPKTKFELFENAIQ